MDNTGSKDGMATMTLEPCPFCGKQPSRQRDGRRNVYFCGEHTHYMHAAEWNRRAHLAQPAPAVDDAALEALIGDSGGLWREDEFRIHGSDLMALLRKAATRALSGEKAGPVDGWSAWHDKEARTWGVRSPSGDCCEVHERAGGPHAEVLRQLAQDLPASPTPDKEGA